MPWDLIVPGSAALGGAAVASLLWLIAGVRRRRNARFAANLVLMPELTGVHSLDTAAALVLEQVRGWVDGAAYHAYWLTADGAAFGLRASIAPTGTPPVMPDYSGLVLDEQPTLVPLSIPADPGRTGPRLAGPRQERWLELPLGAACLVRILLTPGQAVPARRMGQLESACALAAPLIGSVAAWFRAEHEAAEAQRLIASTRVALDTTLRMDKAIELLLTVAAQMVEAAAAVAIVEGADQPVIVAATAQARSLGEEVLRNLHPALRNLPPQPDVVPGGQLGPLGARYNACVRVPVIVGEADAAGCFLFFTQHAPNLNAYQRAALRTLGERAAQLLTNQRQMHAAANDYAETLRILVAAMDGLSSHSQGHSDRLARYARLIAQQLGLSQPECEAIALAGYFHDVGMVAVDPRVVQKPQQLTEDEYARVRQHAELGANLVSTLPAALPLAPIVAGHHERYDGHGYPRGLQGEEIPLGARILAVADLFEAKTAGRAYRSPLPYPQAIAEVESAAGGQLDPGVVAAFVVAMSRLQNAAPPGKPPVRCWELKQMPAHVCAGCPNRTGHVVRCWENPDHLCTRHGDRCEDCIVYTMATASTLQQVGG